jgi:hypothetical protein
MTKFVLVPPGEMRPSLLVEVVAEVNEQVIAELRQEMLRNRCSNAMAIDALLVHLLHDSYRSLDASSIDDEAQIDTSRLLGAASPSASLEARVEQWLQRLAARWDDTLPRESWAAPLLMDIVPAVSGSAVQRLAS